MNSSPRGSMISVAKCELWMEKKQSDIANQMQIHFLFVATLLKCVLQLD